MKHLPMRSKTPADEVGTINGRCGSGGCVGECEWGRRGLPVKERIGEVREGARCAECTRFHGVHPRTPVVVHGRSEVKPTKPMMGPSGSTVGPLMHHDQLAWGVDGMFGKVYIGTMDASISGDGWVEFGWTEMIYSQISNGN